MSAHNGAARHFLDLLDLPATELRDILDASASMKSFLPGRKSA